MSGCPVKAGEAGGDAEGDEGEREGDDAPVAVEAVETADGEPPAGSPTRPPTLWPRRRRSTPPEGSP